MIVAQIGLGRWGLLRSWAWHDVGATLVQAYDISPPPTTRLPPTCVLASSLKDAIRNADLVCISTPPGDVAEIAKLVDEDVLLVVEKPGATTPKDAFKLLERKNLVTGYATIYDPCVATVAGEMSSLKKFRFTSARLHQSSLHRDITVIEDLTIHDLVVCDKLGMFLDEYQIELAGQLPHEAIVKIKSGEKTAFIQSCVKSPNRVRFLRFESDSHVWDVNPDQFAICSDGRSVPPSQARPLFHECSLLLRRAKDPRVKTEGDHERAFRVWGAISRIRKEAGR